MTKTKTSKTTSKTSTEMAPTAVAASGAVPTPVGIVDLGQGADPGTHQTAVELLALQRYLSKDAVKSTLEAALPASTTMEVDATFRIVGTIKRGKDTTKAPTARALRKVTLALLVQRMGCTREAALELLGAVLLEAAQMGEDAEKALLEAHPEVEAAFGRVDELIATLPRIAVQGSISVDVAVQKVIAVLP